MSPVDGAPPSVPPWHAMDAEEVLQRVAATRSGLAETEATRRLAQYGPNELQELRQVSPLKILAAQFTSLIVWILIVAGLVAGALGEWLDAAAILAIVLLNGLIGFTQEFKAEKSIAALRRLTAPNARVRRQGRSSVIPATQVVVGDVLEVEAGDLVAADCRILESASLRSVESALTGEAEAVNKQEATLEEIDLPLGDRRNFLFKGTSIAMGQGLAVVVATGMQTELGRISGLIQQAGADDRTPLQIRLDTFGRMLVWISLSLVVLLFVVGMARGLGLVEMFMTSVSLAVAAVPEGLPAIVTIALALGVLRMSRRRALVRRLPSVETLGSTDVICTDKTGTLTVGDMTVRELFVAGQSFEVTGEGYGPHGEILFEGRATGTEHAGPLLELATSLLACNNAELVLEEGRWQVVGDPTEGAMLAAGHKAGRKREEVERDLPKHHEIPFDSDRKRRSVIRRMAGGELRVFVNGAPDVLLRRCTHIYSESGVRALTEADRRQIERLNENMAARALRVLGSAYRDLPADVVAREVTEEAEHELIFVGLVGMYDPPRPEAKEAIRRCREAGIRVVVITGDHPHTAVAIVRELGLESDAQSVLTGVELNRLKDEELRQRVSATTVYARVTAEHKLRIVRALKANGSVVAMTGDGVNDAPALKGADIGIAMGIKGTEVTKQASDMVITDDNFSTIVAAVEQGRGIYENIRNTLQYLLAGNLAELGLMMGCIVGGLPAPLLPIHLLWINLVTDGLPALCLATDAVDPDVMKLRPRTRGEALTDRSFLVRLIIAGGITAGVSFGVFLWALQHGTVETARSLAFTSLVFCELLKSFAFRSQNKPFWRLSFLSNPQLPLVVAASFALQLLLHHVEFLSRLLKTVTPEWSIRWALLGLGFIPLVVLECVKTAGWLRPGREGGSSPDRQ